MPHGQRLGSQRYIRQPARAPEAHSSSHILTRSHLTNTPPANTFRLPQHAALQDARARGSRLRRLCLCRFDRLARRCPRRGSLLFGPLERLRRPHGGRSRHLGLRCFGRRCCFGCQRRVQGVQAGAKGRSGIAEAGQARPGRRQGRVRAYQRLGQEGQRRDAGGQEQAPGRYAALPRARHRAAHRRPQQPAPDGRRAACAPSDRQPRPRHRAEPRRRSLARPGLAHHRRRGAAQQPGARPVWPRGPAPRHRVRPDRRSRPQPRPSCRSFAAGLQL
ncbi:hypothetical protein FA09DRAFT_355853, partial [Tilletiopsis washingtonensis]